MSGARSTKVLVNNKLTALLARKKLSFLKKLEDLSWINYERRSNLTRSVNRVDVEESIASSINWTYLKKKHKHYENCQKCTYIHFSFKMAERK